MKLNELFLELAEDELDNLWFDNSPAGAPVPDFHARDYWERERHSIEPTVRCSIDDFLDRESLDCDRRVLPLGEGFTARITGVDIDGSGLLVTAEVTR